MHKPTLIVAALAGFGLTTLGMIAHASFRRASMFCVSCLLAFGAAPVHAVIRYVDPNSPGPIHNGTTWTQAYTTLQAALAAAVLGDKVWVANGTYVPTTTTDRTISFLMPQGVKVFGGFAGFGVNETSINQRNIMVNKTVLSGNIGNAGSSADNSYTVVEFDGTTTAIASLDGVYITGGNANGGAGLSAGAGMDISGSPLISNCLFVGNVAANSGGGVLCTGDAAFFGCVFSGNTAATGAAIDSQNNHISISSCTIANNTCTSAPGAVRILNGDGLPFAVQNNIIGSNTGPSGSIETRQISFFNAGPTNVDYNLIMGLSGALGGVGNVSGIYTFVDANGPDDIAGTVDDNYELRGGTIGIDAGGNSEIPDDLNDLDNDGNIAEPLPVDLSYSPRRIEDVINNTGGGVTPVVDMGAYEFRQPIRVICVNDTATGANNGTTWVDAYTNMQSALTEAGDVKEPNPEVIWVAEGTYKPSLPLGRAATFTLLGGVSMFGGFDDNGMQDSLGDRNPHVNRTILSGDIGIGGNNTDNSYHVVTANGSQLFDNTSLDGFIITAGNANGGGADSSGGGLRAINQTAFDPTIRNCKFVGNVSASSGAALDCLAMDLSMVNCVVSGNTAPNGVPVVRFGNTSTPSMINCTVANNQGRGVAVATLTADLTVVNSILVNNGPAGIQFDQLIAVASTQVDYCCIHGLDGSLGGTGNIGVPPFFADPNGADNVLGTPDDDYHLLACSSVIDAADFTVLPDDADDLDDDGLTTGESLQQDIAYAFRWRQDLGVPDTGVGEAPVDMGAFEFHNVPSGGTCPADCFPIGAPNGVVNIDDLVTVITQWGNCLMGNCAGDVFPPCKDQVINIDDLVSVITSWGNCP